MEAGDPPKTPSTPRAVMTPEEIAGTSDPKLLLHLVSQVWNARTPVVKCEKDNEDISRGAILAALRGIAPQNEMEGMLAVQMVSTHNAAMECLSRAAVPGLPPELRDQNLKHAAKLMSIYVQQMEALDKRRGKGQQKITVEHVNVHAGGQARQCRSARSCGVDPLTACGAARPARSVGRGHAAPRGARERESSQ
jgi:hypothetical protein